MFNPKCKSGKKTKAARRAAAMLMTGALGASLAVTGINPGIVNVSAASWQENAEYIFEYLTQRLNYSEAAACGIMANIRCESTFNPHAWNAGGGSYGLCQWTGGRYSRLRNWCGSNGYDYTTIDGQLAYLQFELLNHYTGVENYIRSVENTSEGAYLAGQYYCYHFEAPASRGSVSVYRGNLASGVFWDSYRPAEWYQTDGVWHYILRDGSYKTGWLEIEGDTFYLDEDGNRISGWKNIKGNRYFFDDDGLMVSGWKKIDGRSYYFDESGELITGLIQGNDDLYLVNKNGDLKYSAAVEDYAVAWAEEAARRQTELAAAGTTQSDQPSTAGSGSKAASGLNKEAAADDGTEPSDNSENTFEIGTALADAQTEAVPGTDSARETETVTALADAQTEAVPGTGSTQETETVTALADAGFDSADQTQNITSSVDLLKKKEDAGDLPKLKENTGDLPNLKEDAGDLPKLKEDTGNKEMQDVEDEPEASSPGEVIRENTAVSDSIKPEKTEGLVDLLPAELLRQAAEYIQNASNTQQGKDVDYAQQSEDPVTFPDQYVAAVQASLSAAVALNLEQEEEERLPDPSIGLAYAFYHEQPEASDRILNQFKSEGSSTESQKTGNEDQHVQDSTSKGTETQLPDHDQTAGEETGNGIDLQIPALALADKHRDQQEESSGKEKEAVSDTDQETSDESDDRESSDTSGTSAKAAASEESEEDKDTGSTAEESEEDKDTGTTAEKSEEDKDIGLTGEESEEDKDTGSTAEKSEEDKDTGSTSEESEEDKESGSDTVESEGDKDTGSTSEESEEDKDTGSTSEDSEEDKDTRSTEEKSKEDKDTGSTSEESEEDKDTGSDTEESEEGKTNEQRDQDEDDTSSGHSDKDSSDKDASEEAEDASSGHSSENVSDKNADNDSADSAGTGDEEKEKDSQIHIRLTEKKFYDISEEELEDLADILRERKVLQVVDGKDKDITSKTYMDVEKINKRDYGFSVIIRAEYGDSSDEEKVRIYLTR
ncbi:MAG: hypothetical protein E7239_02960 [Sarcina sp.]|nr:hypothetical protein [Sarcina sp.]